VQPLSFFITISLAIFTAVYCDAVKEVTLTLYCATHVAFIPLHASFASIILLISSIVDIDFKVSNDWPALHLIIDFPLPICEFTYPWGILKTKISPS
jgi:hypothetical protein